MSPDLMLELDLWLADHVMGMTPAEALAFHPGRSAADTLRLVARMQGKYLCRADFGADAGRPWQARFTTSHFGGRADDDNLQVAICLAAKYAALDLNNLKRLLP